MKTRMNLSAMALLMVGLAAGPASAFVFSENWEGHTAGNSANGTNGWSQGGGGNQQLTVFNVGSDPAPGMTGNYASTNDTGTDGSSVNDAGIGGGMDPNAEYILKWTQHHLDQTHNMDFGFRTTAGMNGPRVNLAGQFNGNSGNVYFARPAGNDSVGWPGDNTTTTYEIVVNSSSMELRRNGSAISGGSMTPEYMETLNGIFIFHDTGGTRNMGFIDNITLTPEPGTLALLGIGGLMVLRRHRRAA